MDRLASVGKSPSASQSALALDSNIRNVELALVCPALNRDSDVQVRAAIMYNEKKMQKLNQVLVDAFDLICT